MVWTPEQTGEFLDLVHEDRLYGLYHLIAFRGLRRGEGCGLRWSNVGLDAKTAPVATQLVLDGWEVEEGDPKTSSGARVVALDAETVKVLRTHKAQQAAERLEWGGADMKTVQEMLGHSSITITSDIYTSVLPEVAHRAAEAAAKLVRAGPPEPMSTLRAHMRPKAAQR